MPELIALAVLLHYSLAWSIFFSVFVLLYVGYWQMHYLRKMIRCFHIVNENRLFAIMEHLKITDEELKEVSNRRTISLLTEAQIKALDRDFADIGL